MSRDVSLRQLRYFAVLSEELNYRRAAERLFITQPALSTAIKQLETQFGLALFVRDTQHVTLTDAGTTWLPRVLELLRLADDVVADLVGLAEAGERRVRVGYFIGTGADLFFQLVRAFEDAHPDVVIEPTEYDFADPTAGLRDRSTEVAVIRPPVELPGHQMVILNSERWVACVPRDHRLSGRDQVGIEELLDDPIVCAPESAGIWRDYWMAMDARGGKPPTIAGVAATYEEETTLISRGLGISFTSEASARLYDRAGITYVPIADRAPSYTALAWNPTTVTAPAQALVDLVRTMSDGGVVAAVPGYS